MSDTLRAVQDLGTVVQEPGPHAQRVSRLASSLIGSEILKIAGEVRAIQASGRPVCDLTVGDFSPRQFPVPRAFAEAARAALERGETNYPPANGLPELRKAVRDFYARELGLEYPVESVVVSGGSRPGIYAAFRMIVDPGDRVVFPVPSWNNHHYTHLVGGTPIPLACGAAERFLPTRAMIAPHLSTARLVCLNSPLNPAGTAFTREALEAICVDVLQENERRSKQGERPLYLLYDQVYWMLCFGGTTHVTPPELFPEIARYTILVDGISKAFAATGVRVGWSLGPVDVMSRVSMFLGHVGAWAPRPEQAATAALLANGEAIRSFHATFKRGVQARLDRLHAGLQALAREGFPVDSVPPMGAIYLTARLAPFGRRTASGRELRTNDDIRKWLLEEAGIAIVPFQAFGTHGDDGWFRLSVGAVGEDEIASALDRLTALLRGLV
jgi:aspartate aminotransferase